MSQEKVVFLSNGPKSLYFYRDNEHFQEQQFYLKVYVILLGHCPNNRSFWVTVPIIDPFGSLCQKQPGCCLFFLLLMLLFRSICFQVSNQTDKAASQ